MEPPRALSAKLISDMVEEYERTDCRKNHAQIEEGKYDVKLLISKSLGM
jgi:hypothetical protein